MLLSMFCNNEFAIMMKEKKYIPLVGMNVIFLMEYIPMQDIKDWQAKFEPCHI